MKNVILGTALSLLSLTAIAKDEQWVNGVYWPQEKLAVPQIMNAGYHDIQILYIQPIRCQDGVYDRDSVGFRAISKQDHVVTGVLCDGHIVEKITTVTEEKRTC